MYKSLRSFMFACIAICSATVVYAQSSSKPTIHKYDFSDKGIAQKVSDNGAWALVSAGSSEVVGATPKIIDLSTNTATEIQTESEVKANGSGDYTDVTDDGNLLAGSLKGKPAYFNRTTREWITLPVPDGCSGGYIASITPDGKWAVGSASYSESIYYSKGVLWNLTTGTIVELSNLPSLDMTHEDQHQQYFLDMSADGRYITASMSFSYLQPIAVCCYVYDTQGQSYKFIGFESSDTADWTPEAEGLYFCDEPVISPNGKWIACRAYMVKELAGSDFPTEYDAVGVYNLETKEFTVYDGTDDSGFLPTGIDNEGTVYAASPSSTPIREWSIRHNGYWYSLRQILSQAYDIDFDTRTQYDNTGTPMSVSADGTCVVVMVDPTGESYIINFPEPAASVCESIDLLSNYTLTPSEGSTFSRLTTVDLLFDRDIAVSSSAKATLKDDTGAELKTSMSFKVSDANSKTVSIRFRGTDLEADRQYTVNIPEGTISLKDDATRKNKAITITYNGRAKTPVVLTKAYPEDGSELARIDNTSSYITLTYDVDLAQTDSAKAVLINTTANDTISKLNVYVQGNQVALYPSATQYLYKDQQYQVVLSEGSLTDVTGSGASEKLVLSYAGTYVREMSFDDATLFFDDFSNISQSLSTWMRYEGDHNTPIQIMQDLAFDADNQPWNFSVRDSGKADYCAASHSMYSPAGQSDDWMVIPQIEIPDENCTLRFLGQSYLKSKEDHLKVLVWENSTNINYLTDDVMAQLKAEAKVVFDEQLTPGSSEENLADDWTQYTVSLADYAGKQVYIAFWNNNEDQSAIFLDSIEVKHNTKYLLSLTNAESVVDQSSIDIAGRLTINSDNDTYSSLSLTLCDAEGNDIDTFSKSSLTLKKNDYVDFSFSKPLPLTVGESNSFSIKVQLDDYSDAISSTIKDLAFKPTKRVVLEEYTGTTCVNCPLGILAIENLENIYGDQFIPVSIHTYSGDQLGSGLSGYSSFLGLTAAPSGIVNRCGEISSPMWQNPDTGDYEFSNTLTLWADYVAAEMDTPADIDVSASVKLDTENSTFSLPVSIKSALNAKNQMLNVFVVVCEDGIKAYQQNTFGSISDKNLGEWGKGGKYSSNIVYDYTHNDVVRAVYGSSYNGTSGFFPQTLEAGETYDVTLQGMTLPENIDVMYKAKAIVMIIDANTERVVNAASVSFSTDPSSIADLQNNRSVSVRLNGGAVQVEGLGTQTVQLYNMAGMLIGSGSGNGSVSVSLNGYQGSVIAKISNASGVTTKKFMAR